MPQRIFKRKSNGKSDRNFESNEESHLENIRSRRKPDVNDSTLFTKSDNGCHGGLTIPNRVFVGGIAAGVTEWDLRSKFASYGSVKAVKIIRDHMGISKGYGFVTFSTEEEAKKALEKTEMIFKGRKLNIAPAVKKQNYRPEAQSPSETCIGSYSDSSITEQDSSRKDSMVYSRLSDYPGFTTYEVTTNAFDNSNQYIDGGMSYSSMDLCGYSNAQQVNILSYPTLVYLPPQQAFQCPGTSIAYPINSTVPEVIQFLPTQVCCLNELK
ncbi:protein boule-like [Caerostris darwini]|uniref:Protein boule-like n=1 Tax=Caerostris darwini TaxID=1538125 RepID=A0AAV4T0I7_9ARAC|nr:protein boule-like [Caerostris darwini]